MTSLFKELCVTLRSSGVSAMHALMRKLRDLDLVWLRRSLLRSSSRDQVSQDPLPDQWHVCLTPSPTLCMNLQALC